MGRAGIWGVFFSFFPSFPFFDGGGGGGVQIDGGPEVWLLCIYCTEYDGEVAGKQGRIKVFPPGTATGHAFALFSSLPLVTGKRQFSFNHTYEYVVWIVWTVWTVWIVWIVWTAYGLQSIATTDGTSSKRRTLNLNFISCKLILLSRSPVLYVLLPRMWYDKRKATWHMTYQRHPFSWWRSKESTVTFAKSVVSWL